MESELSKIVEQYEKGHISRRELVSSLAGAVAIAATASTAGAADSRAANTGASTFKAESLHHIALSVSDVARSRDFYVEHLGLKVSSEWLPNNCFLDCGPNFVALFRSSTPGMHHYSYAIPDYDQRTAAEKLRAVDIEPTLQENRIYFDDPDGLVVQLSQAR